MQGSLIVAMNAQEGERLPGIGLKVLHRRQDTPVATGVQQPDDRVAQGGEHLGNRHRTDAAGVLPEGDVAHPVRAILDVPMLADVARQAPRRGATGWQTRDPHHGFLADHARSGGEDVAMNLEDLRGARPAQIRRQGDIERDDGQGADLAAAVAAAVLRRLPPGRLAAGGGAVKTVRIAPAKVGWLSLTTIT
jgi:hypothetical protein